MGAPLDDPAYAPKWPPDRGTVPLVVLKWGPRSQARWFRRFREQLTPQRNGYWDQFYCITADHRGNCCVSCVSEQEDGYYYLEGLCCCRASDA